MNCIQTGNIALEHSGIAGSERNNSSGNFSSRSLLRYPGGKTRGIDFITQFFPAQLNKLLSPFFGGGSIELAVAAKGTRVY
ncbi:MAG TPA: DNA adenine methylase, partial [Agriterribacter sp.]|nr:DNA adenine methylase [Agriterribacter sp.]